MFLCSRTSLIELLVRVILYSHVYIVVILKGEIRKFSKFAATCRSLSITITFGA